MKQRVVVRGGGGHAKVVIDCLIAQGLEVVGVIDKDKGEPLFGIPRLAGYSAGMDKDVCFVIAIGDNGVRRKLAQEILHRFTNAIHPTALISTFSTIGSGCMILHRAIIQADCTVGSHVILNTGCQIDHDGRIGDFVHVAPGAVLCGNVTVGEGTLIGAGAVVMPGIKVGKWSIVGAGAVVSADVGDHSIVTGVPARLIRQNN